MILNFIAYQTKKNLFVSVKTFIYFLKKKNFILIFIFIIIIIILNKVNKVILIREGMI